MKTTSTCLVSRAWAPWLKTLAYLLSVLLILYAVPANVYAELIETVESALDNESIEATDTSSEAKKAVFEITDLREETVKHFRTEDGSFAAVQYNYPVHEKDANGVWQDIDNTLSESGSEYATPNARVKFAKKTTGNETLFTLHDGNRKITMSLSGANKKVAGQVTNTQTEFSEDATQLQKLMTLDKLSSKILYPEILDGVDLEYVVNSCNIKENIIVKERADTYSFTFEIKLNNLEAFLCEDGSIAITDPDSDEVVYTIPKGYMFDANGEYSDAVEYSLSSSGNGSYALTVTADSTWINADERAFPVTIDPPINASSDAGMTDTYIDSANSITTYYADSELKVGRTASAITKVSFWTLNDMPTLPANAYVVSAELSLKCISISASSSSKIGAYTVSTDWTSNNAYSWSMADLATICNTDQLIDYANVSSSSSGDIITWNITSAFRDWHTAGNASYGIALAPLTSSAVDVVFASANSTTATLPQLVVEYRDMKGMESYWSASTHSAGAAGSGYVNHASGNLVFSIGTVSTTDSLFNFTPALIYNSALTDKYNYTSHNPNVPYSIRSTGCGWKLNTNESIVKPLNADYYIWSDGDGTEHYFLPDTTSGTTDYRDEDGLLLTLTADSAGYTMTDADGNVRYFKKITTSSVIAEGGTLNYILDVYGNKLYFDLDEQDRTSGVWLYPFEHSAPIKYLTFSYNDLSALTEIRNEITKQVVSFEYAMSYSNISYTGDDYAGPLYRVKYGHLSNTSVVTDATMTYTYTAAAGSAQGNTYRLATAKDESTGTSIQYTYDEDGRVSKVAEYSGTTAGQAISYTYGQGFAKVRSSGTDDILQAGTTGDDIITCYSIDYQGRTVSAYSTDPSGKAMYGATNSSFEGHDPKFPDSNGDSGNTKNSIKASAVTNGVAVNHIYNSGFDSGSNITGWVTSSSSFSLSSDLSNVSRMLSVSVASGATQSIYQDVTLTSGTYTLSADCFTNTNGSQITLRASSGSTTLEEKTYTMYGALDTATALSPTLTFTLTSSRTVRITIEVTGAGSSTNSIMIDNVMLENNVGAGSFNAVQFGGFADTYADSNTSASPTSCWSANHTGATTSSTQGLQGYGMQITGNVNEDRWVRQRIYVTNPNLLSNSGDASIGSALRRSRTFTVSGFAKAAAQIANEEATFSLKVDIHYYSPASQETLYFHFNKELTGWQFVSGTFTTTPGSIVQYIDVSCNYAYQPNKAYFDNISLVEEKGNSAVNYLYNDKGLLAFSYTPSDCTFYEYDGSNNLIFVYDSQGNGCYYKYSGKTLQSETTFKYNTTNFNLRDWYMDDRDPVGTNLVDQLNCTVISKTVYSINKYGLNTSTVSYAATGNVRSATQKSGTPKLSSSSTYNTAAGSVKFGRVSSTTDTAGNVTRYQYDDKGRLTYEYRSDNEGLYYSYDSLGRLTNVYPLVYSSGLSIETSAEKALYSYNSARRLSQVSTATTVYAFTYDSFGNTKTIKAGGNTLAQYTYNSKNGKLKSMTYGTGSTSTSISYTYDELDRVKEICYNTTDGEQSYNYVYTASGAVHSLESTESGRLYLYNYDSKGHLIGYTECAKDPDNPSANYTDQLQNFYVYDEQDRIYFWQSAFNYTASNGSVYMGDVAYYYEYEDYGDSTNSNSVTNAGELNQLDIMGAGLSNTATINYNYDQLYRLTNKAMETPAGWTMSSGYTYKGTTSATSMLVSNYSSTVAVNGSFAISSFVYTYDVDGNITQISDSNGNTISYEYDNLGQLTRENNGVLGETYVYTYDNGGNRTSKVTYAYTTGTLGTATATQTYTYNNAWGDQLTAVDGVAISYDAIGNPTTFDGYVLTWHGRQLKEMNRNSGQSVLKFKYNADGIRTNKIVNGTNHIYALNGSQIASEAWLNHLVVYLYDESGSPIGMQYRTTSYAAHAFDTFYFEKNLQGDIIAVYNSSGEKVGSYTYDAWGNCTVSVVSGNTTLENNIVRTYNPFRYRGYYYDTETGLYYLQSRYYNPEWGRFLNADGYVNANGDLIGFNMYAYCSNNPVTGYDPSGYVDEEIKDDDVDHVKDPAPVNKGTGNTGKGTYKGTGRGYGSKVHGNSKLSPKEQHGYTIYDRENPVAGGDGVAKVGISGQPLNKNGTSPRANSQVNQWNRACGYDRYYAVIADEYLPNRQAALDWEMRTAAMLRGMGYKMNMHIRP